MANATSATRDTSTNSKLLATQSPWELLDMSRSSWYRLVAEGIVPQPIELPGCRRFWRVADLERWLSKLKPDGGRLRSRRKGGAE